MASAMEKAKQRMQAKEKPALPKVSPGAAPGEPAATPTLSGQRIQHSSGLEVPIEFYDLDSASQKRFLAALEQKQDEAAAESRFDQVALRVLDEIDKLRGQVKGLEASLLAAVGVIEKQKQDLEAIDTSLKVEKSNALAEQQSQLADAAVNAAVIETSLRNQTAQLQAEYDKQGVEIQAQLDAAEQSVSGFEGRMKSSTQLMQERSNAVVAKLSDAENRQVRLGVALTELEDQADALGTPITRAEVQALITDAVATEWRSQVEAITDAVVAEVRDQFPTGLGGQRADSSRSRQLREDANRFQLEATS